jgi:hypothetical protein
MDGLFKARKQTGEEMLDDLKGDGLIIFGKEQANKKAYLEVNDDYVDLVFKLILSVLPLGLHNPLFSTHL